jgi:diacylglycerol kinase (ATP)
MRAHVVINPHAALLQRKPERIAAVVEACRGRARVAITDTIAALDGACIEAHEQGAELVVLCGGDGSYMAGVSSLARAYGERPLPAVCLAPGGSTSTVARNWGVLLRNPARHVRAVLNLAANGDLPISI